MGGMGTHSAMLSALAPFTLTFPWCINTCVAFSSTSLLALTLSDLPSVSTTADPLVCVNTGNGLRFGFPICALTARVVLDATRPRMTKLRHFLL